ncbi:MAG: hypothetical protein QOJ15_10609, partial [Bradyrhizobium sp.]|nr:hypothetical protein [Bradyrhizobium sp.]
TSGHKVLLTKSQQTFALLAEQTPDRHRRDF